MSILLISPLGKHKGKPVHEIQVDIPNGLKTSMITFGGIITSVCVPNRDGKYADIALGFDGLTPYEHDEHCVGSLVGSFANRIDSGRVTIDGIVHQLTQNSGIHHLHGGHQGFNRIVWSLESFEESDYDARIILKHTYKEGTDGYPSDLAVQVIFHFSRDSIAITYQAESSKTTIINPTHHLYFNLSGDFNSTISDHELEIEAKHYLPVRQDQIPTGEIAKVENTPFDFLKQKNIGRQMTNSHSQLDIGSGFDHCFVLDKGISDEPVHSATLHHPESGRKMEVFTTEPGIQFYTGNSLHNKMFDKQGACLTKHSGLCLETQHFPDSPNHSHFPSTLLKPGQVFRSKTVYQFTTDK